MDSDIPETMGLAQVRISLEVSFVQHRLSLLIYPVESVHRSQLLDYFFLNYAPTTDLEH